MSSAGSPVARCAEQNPVVGGVFLSLPEMAADGSVPEWIPLLPAGPDIKARDGRSWILDSQAVIDRTMENEADPPLDINHSTEKRGRWGAESPAAGWLKAFQVRDDGATWARVEWTDRGMEAVKAREYRYVSPAFTHIPDSDGNRIIQRISSAALTCLPALRMPALNQEDCPMGDKNTQNSPKPAPEPAPAGGSPSPSPDLATMVPRADYDHAMERARTAEQRVAQREQEERDAEISECVDKAVADGKIAPATADYHKAACATEGGLDRFKSMVDAAPSIGQPAGAGTSPPPSGGGTALTSEDRKVAAMMGLSEEQMAGVK